MEVLEFMHFMCDFIIKVLESREFPSTKKRTVMGNLLENNKLTGQELTDLYCIIRRGLNY
jgi:hypothetical protein